MPSIPIVLEYFGRSFKVGDRVKCFIWNPPIKKWVSGTINEFFPSRTTYKGPTRILCKEGWKAMKEQFPTQDLDIVVILDDEEKGILTYDDYCHIRMSIKTDERISNNPDDLFRGFGWNTSGQYVIFENEPEYDPFLKQKRGRPKKLPF